MCNNTFLIGGQYLNTFSTANKFRLVTTSTGCSRTVHFNNKLEGNAAEWYSICSRSKVLNLQGYSIQANGFIGCIQKVALDEKRNMKVTQENSSNHRSS